MEYKAFFIQHQNLVCLSSGICFFHLYSIQFVLFLVCMNAWYVDCSDRCFCSMGVCLSVCDSASYKFEVQT